MSTFKVVFEEDDDEDDDDEVVVVVVVLPMALPVDRGTTHGACLPDILFSGVIGCLLCLVLLFVLFFSFPLDLLARILSRYSLCSVSLERRRFSWTVFSNSN